MVFEEIDFGVTAQTLTITSSLFNYIEEVELEISWTANDYSWVKFADSAALSTGLHIQYNGTNLYPTVKDNHDWTKLSDTTNINVDTDATTKRVQLTAQFDFKRLRPGNVGLYMGNGVNTLDVVIGDDLSAIADEMELIFYGY